MYRLRPFYSRRSNLLKDVEEENCISEENEVASNIRMESFMSSYSLVSE